MATPTKLLPIVGGQNSSEDPKTRDALQELQQLLDPAYVGLGPENLTAVMAEALGLNTATAKRAGKSVVATAETRNVTNFGLLTTPDRVSSLVLPTDGVIFVLYQAQWEFTTNGGTNSGGPQAAIFLNGNQLKTLSNSNGSIGTAAQQATHSIPNAAKWESLYTAPWGLDNSAGLTGPATGAVLPTTGLAFGDLDNRRGGMAMIWAAAGTYDVSVQYRVAGAGDVLTARDRRLLAWVKA